jgi:hypothetical protein
LSTAKQEDLAMVVIHQEFTLMHIPMVFPTLVANNTLLRTLLEENVNQLTYAKIAHGLPQPLMMMDKMLVGLLTSNTTMLVTTILSQVQLP